MRATRSPRASFVLPALLEALRRPVDGRGSDHVVNQADSALGGDGISFLKSAGDAPFRAREVGGGGGEEPDSGEIEDWRVFKRKGRAVRRSVGLREARTARARPESAGSAAPARAFPSKERRLRRKGREGSRNRGVVSTWSRDCKREYRPRSPFKCRRTKGLRECARARGVGSDPTPRGRGTPSHRIRGSSGLLRDASRHRLSDRPRGRSRRDR